MAHELMRQRARDVGDREPEHHLLEWRRVSGLEPLADELADFFARDFFRFDFFPDLDRGIGGIAGAKCRVEFFQRRLREIDQLDLNFRLVTQCSPSTTSSDRGTNIMPRMSDSHAGRSGLRTVVDSQIASLAARA